MDTSIFSWLSEHYHWQLSLLTAVGVIAVTFVGKHLLLLVPTIREAQAINKEAAKERMARSYYPPIQNRSKFWGFLTQLGIFVLALPFCLTLKPEAWWKIPLNVFVILMFYDFFYYLVHRFVFHADGPFGGPLVWVHAVHHQRHNPCRLDSNYLHPLETCAGLALYGASIFVLSRFMGNFDVITIIVTWIAFSEINLHNHDLWKVDRLPFKYLSYMSKMHHIHHAKFTGGNFATISLFYDWLFGTYDTGQGYKKHTVPLDVQAKKT